MERNLALENADDLLAEVEAGRWARGLLPWVPLMAGGDDPSTIDRWKKLAEAEPDLRIRSEYGGLAKVMASAAKRFPVWKAALEGWNMYESEAVTEWVTEGEQRGYATAVVAVLEARFGQIPSDAAAAIRAATDLTALRGWVTAAATTPSLDDFRRTSGV